MADDLARDWHWLDMALGVGVVIIALNAGRRGFVREAGTLLGLGIGLVLAARLAPALVERVGDRFGPVPFAGEVAYAVTVLLVAVASSAAAEVLRSLLCLPGFSFVDRLAGLGLGLVEGAAGLGLLLLMATRVGVIGSGVRALEGSTLAPVLVRCWLSVSALLPPELGAPSAV